MTTLTSKLRKLMAIEDNMSWDEEDALHELDRACLRGKYLENARLLPVIEKLLAVLEALEFECGNQCNPEYNPCDARKALADLEALIETKQE